MDNVTNITWYAVRCCCEATKILGFLPLPTTGERAHKIRDRQGRSHQVILRMISDMRMPVAQTTSSFCADTSIEIGKEIAIYSDDRPIEFWRTIPEFLEVVDNER